MVIFNDSPMSYLARAVRDKKISGEDATEEQLHRLEAMRRLLLRVGAVHAVSWLWPGRGSCSAGRAEDGSGGAETASQSATQPTSMLLPIVWRRTRRRGVALPALFRCGWLLLLLLCDVSF